MKFLPLLLLSCVLLAAGGCKPKARDIAPLARKEAANYVSEAQFAMSLRDYARAEPLLAKAAKLCPDNGDYWVNLGAARIRQGNKSGAKSAYEEARSAYHDAYEIDAKESEAALQEVYVLALLGRVEDARKALGKAQRRFPDDRAIRGFAENGQLDRILADPTFKEVAL